MFHKRSEILEELKIGFVEEKNFVHYKLIGLNIPIKWMATDFQNKSKNINRKMKTFFFNSGL
jgi:hypothetical protein